MSVMMLSLLLVVAPCQAAAGQNDDQKTLQGTWRVTAIAEKGGRMSVEGAYTLTFRDNTLRQLHKTTNGADFHYSFKLDPGKKPKTIDMTITRAGSAMDKGEVGKTILGIYSLEGGELKLCTNPETRPTTFDTKRNGGDTVLLLLKREQK